MTKTRAQKQRTASRRRNAIVNNPRLNSPYKNVVVVQPNRNSRRRRATGPSMVSRGMGYSVPNSLGFTRTERDLLVNDGRFAASEITAPSAGSTIIRRQRATPGVVTKLGATFVCNTEYWIDVASLGGFNVTRYPFHPVNVTWLSGQALCYSKFRPVAVRYIYIPVCATSTSGTFTMSLGYDFNDSLPTNQRQLQVAYQATTSPPWAGFEGTSLLNQHFAPETGGAVVIDVDCTRFQDKYYPVRTSAGFNAETPTDQNQFAPFYLQVATTGAALEWGNVFVQYIMEFIEPTAPDRNS